jgi:hypothetical protein
LIYLFKFDDVNAFHMLRSYFSSLQILLISCVVYHNIFAEVCNPPQWRSWCTKIDVTSDLVVAYFSACIVCNETNKFINQLRIVAFYGSYHYCCGIYSVTPALFTYFIGILLGKTSTVIEAIHELRRRRPHCRILACAPSDAAADVICLRLANPSKSACDTDLHAAPMSPSELLRLNWWQRTTLSVPAALHPYCSMSGNFYEIPSAYRLSTFSVVVCTCGTAGAIAALPGFHKSKVGFDVVIVDEASQATEAEVSPLI